MWHIRKEWQNPTYLLKMFIVLVIFIFQEVFAQLNETSDSVSVSFFEIYNEKVFDLLGDNKVRI